MQIYQEDDYKIDGKTIGVTAIVDNEKWYAKMTATNVFLMQNEQDVKEYIAQQLAAQMASLFEKKILEAMSAQEIQQEFAKGGLLTYSSLYGASNLDKVSLLQWNTNPAAEISTYSSNNPLPGLSYKLPGASFKVNHPVTGTETTLRQVVISLNDTYHWTREEIADWLESIHDPEGITGPNLNFQIGGEDVQD